MFLHNYEVTGFFYLKMLYDANSLGTPPITFDLLHENASQYARNYIQ